ncbi:hypothetical protein D3C73_1499610 [compost metagenome]
MLIDNLLDRLGQQPVLILTPAPALLGHLLHHFQQHGFNLIQCLFLQNAPVDRLQINR